MTAQALIAGARLASQVDGGFPYARPSVAYVLRTPDGDLRCNPQGRDELRAFVQAARDGATLCAIWPGTYRSDTFIIDDLDAMVEGVSWLR